MSHNHKSTAKNYKDDLRKLLHRGLKELPDLKIMICEPFVVKGGSAIVEEKWFPALILYQTATKKIAADYKAG